MSRSPTDGSFEATATQRDGLQRGREYPMRQLNALMWGRGGPDDRSPSDPVALGGCGRLRDTGSWVDIYDTGDRWAPADLVTCKNALLCDFCGPRRQAESAERFEWHFEDWLAGGGQLLSVRVSAAYMKGDDLGVTYDILNRAFGRLHKMGAWKAAGIVDYSRVLHLRYHPGRNAFYPHLHLVTFIPQGVVIDEPATETALQEAWATAVERTIKARIADIERIANWEHASDLEMAWRDRIARGIGHRVSRRHGLFARVVTSSWRALYAWHWADEDHEPERLDVHRDDLGPDYEPRHLDDDEDGSWPLYKLAEAALNGNQVAWQAWGEVCRAMKGVSIVKSSRMLDRVWKAHQAEQPETTPVETLPLAVQVHSGLWDLLRRRGYTQMGLELGRTHGVEAMVDWWAKRLGQSVWATDEPVPRLFARDGPRELLLLAELTAQEGTRS